MTAVYPGSFDPVTLGHLDIIKRAAKIADRLIIAVSDNPAKRLLFTTEERVEFLLYETRDIKNAEVTVFSGMLAEVAAEKKADVIIRGVRDYNDFQYETVMARYNRELTGGTDTWFIAPSAEFSHISSSAVKETARLLVKSGFKTDILSTLVPERVMFELTTRM